MTNQESMALSDSATPVADRAGAPASGAPNNVALLDERRSRSRLRFRTARIEGGAGDVVAVLDKVVLDHKLGLYPRWARPALGHYRYTAIGGRMKRLLDVVLSAVLLVVLGPVLAGLAVAVKATSRGPALFRQERVGFGEQRFVILKFRTMWTGSDEEVHRKLVQGMLREEIEQAADGVFKLTSDDRVTPLGRWLRRTSLDELPQLVNVLRGEMSLVGPRPSLGYEVEQYDPVHRLRALSMPGLTGLWQVEGRNDLHLREALDLDVTYIETCSLRSDLRILFKTFRSVLSGV